MRFTKNDILEMFHRQDVVYRLALLSSHWLRGGNQFQPSASSLARDLQMEMRGQWISFADLAVMLEYNLSMITISSDLVMNQLHTIVRAPFELLRDYCEDYDVIAPEAALLATLKQASWFEFARLIRNAVSHNFLFDFNKRDRSLLPLTWSGITLTEDLHGQSMKYHLWHKPGYELFLEMRAFASTLPEFVKHDQ